MKNRSLKSLRSIALTGLLFFTGLTVRPAWTQTGGGYINYAQTMGAPLDTTLETIDFPQAPIWIHASAVGMGKTQTSNGLSYNGMLINPALLSDGKNRFDILGLQLSFPKSTFDAASFLKKNRQQFKTGDFLKSLGRGFQEYYTAETPEQQAGAIRKINQALSFPNELYSTIIGDVNNPLTNGLSVIPNLQVQYGRWGFSLFGKGQIGFVVNPGSTIPKILGLHIQENTTDLTVDMIKNLAEILGSAFDENGDVSFDALPQAFALSYIDIVGVLGRSYALSPNLDIGANIKIVNRRFSTKIINPDNFQDVLSEARKELKHTATGFTADLGFLYRSPKNGMRVGASLLNVFPVKTITSTTGLQFTIPSNVSYVDDGTGNPAVGSVDLEGYYHPDPMGDTLLVIEKSQVNVKQPFELKAPLLANLGVSYPIKSNWDIALDWVDIFSKDETFDGLGDRVRVGTEYRFSNWNPLVSVRGGVSEKHLTVGAGVQTRFARIDLAYARDPFLEKNVFFGQLQLGW
jgi:hypothetical protein